VAEATRIPDAVSRARHLRTIFALISEIPLHSDSYATALEVRNEMHRLHPEWMTLAPDLRELNALIHHRQELYGRLQDHPALEFDPAYAATVREAVGSLKLAQQERRRLLLTMPELTLELSTVGGEASSSQLEWFNSLPEGDKYWRNRSRSVWRSALLGEPAMRDYADWLGPYVNGVPPEPAWSEFWLFEAKVENVRRDQTIEVCNHYQASERVGAGNAIDMLLSVHLLDSDAVVTADVPFYRILCRVVESHGPFRASPLLVDRGADDFLSNVKLAIMSAGRRLKQQ